MLREVAQFILRNLQIQTIPKDGFGNYPQLIKYLKRNNLKLEQINNSDEIFLKQNEPHQVLLNVINHFYYILQVHSFSLSSVTQEVPKFIKKNEDFFNLWVVYIQAQKHYQNKQKDTDNTQLQDTQKVNTIVEEEFEINLLESNEDIIKLLDYIYKAFIELEIKREKQFQQDDVMMDFDNYWLDNQDIEQEDDEAYEDPIIIQESSISHDELNKQQYFAQWESKQQ